MDQDFSTNNDSTNNSTNNDADARGGEPMRADESVRERQLNVLREKLRQVDRQLASVTQKNGRLVSMLETARSEIVRLKDALDKEGDAPFSFATIVGINHRQPARPGVNTQATSGDSVDIFQSGRKIRVGVSPLINMDLLSTGQEVLLNESLVIVAALGYERAGELATVKELIGRDRVLMVGRSDEERVFRLSGQLQRERLRVGDALSVDSRTGYALEKIPRSEVENLILEEVPDITYNEIGGLGPQIEQIRDAVELPFLHPDLYREHGL